MSILGKIFKTKLDQRQFEFKDEYWKDLEKRLDAHDGKGGFNYKNLILGSFGAAVIISVAVWFFYPQKEAGSPIVVQATTEGVQKTEGITNEENLKTGVSDNNINKPGISDLSSELSNSSKESQLKINGTQGAEKMKAESVNNRSSINAEIKNSPGEKTVNKDENIPAEIFDRNERIAEIQSRKNENTKTETEKVSEKENEVTLDNSPLVSNGKPVPESLISAEMESGVSSSMKTENKEVFANADIKNRAVLMEKIFPARLKIYESDLKTTAFENKIRRRKNSYFAQLYSGMLYTGKILKSKDEKLAEYISRRNEEESPALSGNFGADFGIELKQWNISIGINYAQQGEVVDYKPEFYQWLKKSTSTWNIVDNSFWKYDTVNTLSYTVTEGSWQMVDTTIGYWSNNVYVPYDTISIQQYMVDSEYVQTIYVTDSNYVSKFDTTEENIQIDSTNQLVNDPSLKSEKTTTKISYYEFPVMIGYEFPVSRFSVMLRTGFSVGLLSKFSATYLKNDISGTEQVDISRLNKTMLNYLLKAGVLFYVTENTVINFEPMFRMNLNSVFKDTGFTQQYWNAGMNLGVMYRF